MKIYLVFVFFIIFVLPSKAQETINLPKPSGVLNQLFYLQRSQNTNTVIYQLNIKNGVLDSVEPVHIFWISYAEKGQFEELTSIQRKRAYGLESKWVETDRYELRFNANKKEVLQLKKGTDNQFHVYEFINEKPAILTKIYLQLHSGSLFSPNIEYIILTGLDPTSQETVVEQRKI